MFTSLPLFKYHIVARLPGYFLVSWDHRVAPLFFCFPILLFLRVRIENAQLQICEHFPSESCRSPQRQCSIFCFSCETPRGPAVFSYPLRDLKVYYFSVFLFFWNVALSATQFWIINHRFIQIPRLLDCSALCSPTWSRSESIPSPS